MNQAGADISNVMLTLQWRNGRNAVRLRQFISVVTHSEFASESANFSSVRPSPSPRIFGGRK